MKNRIVGLISAVVIVLITLMPVAIQPTAAQTIEPPPEPIILEHCQPGKPCKNENGESYMLLDDQLLNARNNSPTGIGDSDDYGYTLSQTTYNWIDASSGADTGINNSYDFTSAISLPFAFPFYENTYSQVYITGSGYITFENYGWSYASGEIPNTSAPNNIIAPFWKYITYANSSRVYYKSFTDKFVVEWFSVLDSDNELYTFESILYPNGNIQFQYQTLPVISPEYGWWCSTVGIEDASGVNGLPYWDYCDYPEATSSSSVIFTRPAPSARVQITPLYQGEFTYSSEVDEFFFTLYNIGNLGADIYDFDVFTSWTVTLHEAESDNPLTDTDGDGKIDSGTIPQGGQKEILVRVTAPNGLSVGAHNNTSIDVTSSLNTTKTKTATLESTVPAAFAQTFGYFTESEGRNINSELIWPGVQMDVLVGQHAWNSYEPAIAETPDNHFIHVWRDYEWSEDYSEGWILKYSITDKLGRITKAVTNLTTINPSPNMDTADYSYSLAVSSDGKIGITWTRSLYDDANGLQNYNIWFAILDTAGRITFGPVNLTNNNEWGSYENENMVEVYDSNIAAADDNRFMITWTKWSQVDGLENIYYTIRQSNGTVVIPNTNMTSSSGNTDYGYVVLTSLTNNRFFISYVRWVYSDPYYYSYNLFRVLDSNGITLKPESELNYSIDDAIQLTGGNILFTLTYGNGIRYGILNGTTYVPIYVSATITHPSNTSYVNTVSTTKDANNRGILTWTDENGRYLYYAYVNGSNGGLLSGPFISHWFEEGISVNYDGQITTTNSWQPASGTDLFSEFSADLYGAEPGGVAILRLTYGNQALTTATGPQLTLTLPDGLSYAGDNSGIVPTISANTVTWNLPNLEFADVGAFIVYVSVPAEDPIGTIYEISQSLTFDGEDIDPSNDSENAEVMVATMTYLPLINR